MKALQVAVGGLIADDQIALIKFKRNQLAGYWGLPGGKFEDGEFLEEAITREFTEEVGHPVRLEEFCAVVDEEVTRPEGASRLTLYVCRLKPVGALTPTPRDLGEEGEIGWFPVDDLRALKDHIVPSDYRMFTDILQGGGHGYYRCRMSVEQSAITLNSFDSVG